MNQACFGVDIGGTSVKLGLVSRSGELLTKVEFPSEKEQCAMFDEIAAQIQSIRDRFPLVECVGVGVGVPGPVLEQKRVLGCVNLNWGEIDVSQELSSRLSLPVRVENDANLATLGEMWQGAGQGHRNLVMLTVGTGVGAGVIADGRIIDGCVGAAGEAGHIPMPYHTDWSCSCGKTGCLEVTASATGIIRAAKEYAPFKDMLSVTAKDVFDAAKAGNEDAQRVVDEAGACLGMATAMIGCIVNPELFLIGGGVSAAGRMLLTPIEEAYRKWVFAPCRNARFALAELGNNAGIYGGAGLFFCQA